VERELSDRLRNAGSREERRRLYEEVYRELNERLPHHPLVVRADDSAARDVMTAPQVRLLRSFASRDTSFLEIGAGDAGVARALAPFVSSALALDVTDTNMHGTSRDGNFEFRLFDGFDPGVPAGSMDLAYSMDVVEHLHREDMLEQTAAVLRTLRSGGLYVCVTPNGLSGPHDVSRHFDDSPRGFHLYEYSATELASAFRTAGFSKVKFVVSAAGWRLTPLLPASLLVPVEWVIGRLPRSIRLPVGRGLAAVKLVGVR